MVEAVRKSSTAKIVSSPAKQSNGIANKKKLLIIPFWLPSIEG